jgi:hypothetical protein
VIEQSPRTRPLSGQGRDLESGGWWIGAGACSIFGGVAAMMVASYFAPSAWNILARDGDVMSPVQFLIVSIMCAGLVIFGAAFALYGAAVVSRRGR